MRPSSRTYDCPEVGAERTSSEILSPALSHFVEPEVWSKANGVGINSLREYLRREIDPMPHVRMGRKYLVDDALAVDWMRRNFGVGVAR